MNLAKFKKADRHGRMEFPMIFVITTLFSMDAGIIFLYAVGMMHVEHGSTDANIRNFEDALWLGVMSISTIGFGDHYATTSLGRILTVGLFIFGPMVLGAFFQVGSSIMKTDANITNREQMSILMEVLRIANKIQFHHGIEDQTRKRDHGLDHLLEQQVFESDKYCGWISLGIDNTQVYVISIHASAKQDGHLPMHRHIYGSDQYAYAKELFDFYCKNPDVF